MDCICLKRKHRKRKEESKFRPITPHSSPSHSQPSTLGADGRLPKVNSTGLWVGAPSMYTGVAPSPAYYYGPGKMPSQQGSLHSGLIPRASSDPRIPNNVPVVGMQPRIYHSSQPLAPVFEMPATTGPSSGLEIYDVYQFGGGNSRSKLVEEKHSKHYYEEVAKPGSRLARSQSDVHEKPKKPPSRNLRSRDASGSSKQASSKGKVNRSSSSGSKDKAPSPPRPSSSSVILQSHTRSNSREFGFSSSAPGARLGMQSKSLDSLDGHLSKSGLGSDGGYFNKGFDPRFGSGGVSSLSGDIILKPAAPIPPKAAVVAAAPSVLSSSTPRSSAFLPNGVIAGNVSNSKDKNSNDNIVGENEAQVDTSATDSMKLLAKNKTDDQKTVVAVGKSEETPSSGVISKYSASNTAVNDVDDKIDDVINVDDKDLSKGHIHYIYQGDIYAVPDKQGDDSENPIISRMKEMVVEKTRTNSTKSMSSSRGQNKENEFPLSSTNNTPRSFNSDSIIAIDPEYQEIGDIVKAMENKNDEEGQSSANPGDAVKSDHSQNNSANEPEMSDTVEAGTGSTLTSNENRNLADQVDGSYLPLPTSPVYLRQQSGSSSKAGDTTFEEINNAGKRITASAFEFLNTYLSDDEGEDGHTSP